ncbi:MAG: holo-acyl-carrier protein synthase [bacterium]|nr:MAG: holo-acyl-carrier protein synthase [bacterium]KAF0149899.1 MAG: holo-acyl-carrier protein synthase [bacterium]KAF0166361.1 MAG: holo-acyl-carrier protein synthase [bacterium]TXT16980.1 MAG: holo-acyl-carrier protein synthase [bacterium]
MILGIGTDIVAVERLRAMHANHGERLARRLLAPAEWDDYARVPDKPRLLAKRFAAKEALGKALGTGIRAPLTLTACWVAHDALGRPDFACAPELAGWLRERGAGALHLSLSDEQDTVVAFVVVERL